MSDTAPTQAKMVMLKRANYRTWIVQAKDYILAIDHDDAVTMWEIYEWTQAAHPGDPDPINFDFQAVTNTAQRKLRVLHNKAFMFFRQHLSPPIFNTTLRLPTSVPVLLRHLRTYWHAHSPLDRAALTNEYRAMKLSHYEDMQAYVSSFENMVFTLREYGIGGARDDEDIIYQFEWGLPDAWADKISIRSGHVPAHTADQAFAWYCQEARSHRNTKMPGAPVTAAQRSITDSAHATSHNPLQRRVDSNGQERIFATLEVCRNHAKGKCSRPNGTCRFYHPPTPGGYQPQTPARGTQAPARSSSRISAPKSATGALYCVYCRQNGHQVDVCPALKAKKDRLAGRDTTHATIAPTTHATITPTFEEMAWATGNLPLDY